ncbi:MAG TPA: hypothetical protein VIW03_10595 [Anaeromyxobacter sp.]
MLRVERAPGALTVVSRLAKPRVLAVVGGVLAALALVTSHPAPGAALAAGGAATLVVLLGGRAVRARFERGRVTVRPAVPFQRAERRPLASFSGARVETFAEARRRRAEGLARAYAARSGTEMPAWLRAPDAPTPNDALRRIVLVTRDGDPFPVTAWLAEDDLEPARLAIEAVVA